MRHKFGYKTLIALALCAALLSAGPGTTFAAGGDDWEDDGSYGDEGEWVGDDGESYDDEESWDDEAAYEDEEPSAPKSSGTSALLNELYQKQDEIESGIEQLKNREQELQANIANAKNEKERAIAERNGLAYEISLRSEMITALQEKIRLLGEEIELRLIYISEKQDEIDANYRLLQKRLGAMYMQDDGSLLGLLIGSDSFSDFLTRSEYMVLVAEHDRNLLRELTDQRVSIEEERADLETAMTSEETNKASVEDEKAALDALHVEASQQVQDIDAMEQEFMANLAENQARQHAMQAELEQVFQQIEWSKNPYAGGVMLWPSAGFSLITSEYGPRFGGNDNHTGIDISGSGIFGSQVLAAADGVVKMVNYSGDGYGNYVIIDHGLDENGRSVATLYAHNSELLVSNGQSVSRGDPIALVGSTGWSTGPHIHFEVRLNGQHVSPWNYLGS